MQEKEATVGGILMRWHEYGDPAGLPVVLVHGIPTGPAPIAPAVRRLPRFALHLILSSFLRRGHDDQEIASEAIRTHWPHYRHHGTDAFVRQIRSLDVEDTRAVADQLPRLQGIPARVVWGAADQFQKLEYGQRLARDLSTTLKIIEKGKHFTPEDHADVIAAELQTLIEDAFSRQAPREMH